MNLIQAKLFKAYFQSVLAINLKKSFFWFFCLINSVKNCHNCFPWRLKLVKNYERFVCYLGCKIHLWPLCVFLICGSGPVLFLLSRFLGFLCSVFFEGDLNRYK